MSYQLKGGIAYHIHDENSGYAKRELMNELCREAACQIRSAYEYKLANRINGTEKANECLAKAIGLYERASILGNVGVRTKLGDMYRDGIGVERDIRKAFSWYRKGRNMEAIRRLALEEGLYAGNLPLHFTDEELDTMQASLDARVKSKKLIN